MNKKILVTFCALALGAFLWMGSSGGRAASANAGNTGAPGDAGTCGNAGCHASSDIEVMLSISLTDANSNPVTQYTPGESYTATVTVTHTGGNNPAAYGFQMISLKDADDTDLAAFSNPSANAQVSTTTSNKQYAEHNGPSNTNTFTVDWTAPATGTGNVTFYASGNGVNGNGVPTGDGANNTSLTLTEMTVSTQNPTATDWGMTLFPNPAEDVLNVSLDNSSEVYQVSIVDLSGKLLRSQSVNSSSNGFQIQVADLPSGHYTLQLEADGEAAVAKFLKK